MREVDFGLSDGMDTANTVATVINNGIPLQDLGPKEIESSLKYRVAFDVYQKRILRACFQERPTGSIKEEAENFLDRFSSVRNEMIYQLISNADETELYMVCCLIDTSPYTLTQMALQMRREEEERGDLESVDDFNLAVSIMREGDKIWREETRERFTLG